MPNETQLTTDTVTDAGALDTNVNTPVIVQPVVSPPVTPGLNPEVYAPDGKTWKSKFFGAEGRAQQVETRRDTMTGAYEQQVVDLQAELQQVRAKNAEMEGQIQTLVAQTNVIPELREELEQAAIAAAEADRLKLLMNYPALLTAQVEEQVTVEGQEEPQVVSVNPFLRLIENTTLTGDDLARELNRLASVLPTTPFAAAPTTEPLPVVEGAAPSPAAPATGGDASAFQAEALMWHALVIAGEMGPNGEDPREKEREAWHNKNKAMAAAQTT